jgi:hypothetical protein
LLTHNTSGPCRFFNLVSKEIQGETARLKAILELDVNKSLPPWERWFKIKNASELPTNKVVPQHFLYNELLEEFKNNNGNPTHCPQINYSNMKADNVPNELEWDDFLRKKLSNNGADKTKGWIKPNPVEGLSELSPSGEKYPTFDRIIDGVDSEYFNPASTGENLRKRLRDKFVDCIGKKKSKRIYIDLSGKEGDLNELIRSSVLGESNIHPEVQSLEIFYRVGDDLIQFLHQK